jgi:hypothetical protein
MSRPRAKALASREESGLETVVVHSGWVGTG